MNDSNNLIPGRNGGTLKPYKKGQSGNPDGLPKGYKHLKTILRKASMAKLPWKDLQGKKMIMKAGEAMVYTMYAHAIKGDTKAAKIIFEYQEDKSLQVTGAGGAPIMVQIIDDIPAS